MSAAALSIPLHLATVWAVGPVAATKTAPKADRSKTVRTKADWVEREALPPVNLAFYRKHTESMLRRYLYASMQVGRAPSILGDPVGRVGYQAARSARLRTRLSSCSTWSAAWSGLARSIGRC